MTDQDYDAFVTEFRRLSAALERFKQSPEAIATRAGAYFHVLKRYPLAEVCAKADAWLRTQEKFPAPAAWAEQIVTKSVEYRLMSDEDSRAYLEAERLGFEGTTACECGPCLDAGLQTRAERSLRYVPLEDLDGRPERARNAVTQALVTPGQWLHGWPLVRFYHARANFWTRAYAKCGIGQPQQERLARVPFEQRIEQIFQKVKAIT